MLTQEVAARAICDATTEVFTTMLSDTPAAGAPFVDRSGGGTSEGVVALVGLTGEWVGTGVVTCSATLASRLSAVLLMSEPEPDEAVNEEVLDSMAEITNMIVGNVKNLLEEELGALQISIPTVVYGKNLTTRSVNEGEWYVVPFDCGGDRLEVRLCLVPSKVKQALRASFALHQAVAVN